MSIALSIESSNFKVKPILKWAGGKSQLLDVLLPLIPNHYGKYIEPFFGGGALFFALNPDNAVIADSNPELINVYKVIAGDVEALIVALRKHRNDEAHFYKTRALDHTKLNSVRAAARTIYLNKTCFNGLYRVNRKGQFNVPFGRYTNPSFCDEDKLRLVSDILKRKKIICADYKTVLRRHAKAGDFVYLDPPYLPIAKYSDFKRYTKEQFYEEDHREMALEIERLNDLGCHVILTNSNHPLVHELYGKHKIDVFKTKRNINSKAKKRQGEDVVVNMKPYKKNFNDHIITSDLSAQVRKYPSTRFMGAKTKLLPYIRDIVKEFDCNKVLDLFAGSGVVSYMLKDEGKQVISNDYMAMSAVFCKSLIENNKVILPQEKAESLMKVCTKGNDNFVQDNFEGLYFKQEENILIDNIRTNIKKIHNVYHKAIATSALIRTCLKKRPRGIFTYIGHRYDDGRKDLQTSFEDHFLNAVKKINDAVFDNNKDNQVKCEDAMSVRAKPDLIYLDPPYYSPYSDNEYVRRYHFVEGIARDWKDVQMQWHTKTKKFKSYPTPFSTRNGAHYAFDRLFKLYKDSVIVVSYSSNSLPTLDEMSALLAKYKQHVEVISVDYNYSFGNQGHKRKNNNKVKEYIFIGY
ncbi:MAG: Dam family site-specific DNA-(adenine-N6)-methyltransferase [Gammaproteobacteria bacterium]|jgi:DNA adenine methylase